MANDILFNENGTFKELDGDFAFGKADKQLMSDIIKAVPGHYKEFPLIGANVYKFINSRANPQVVSRDISVALKADIFKNPKVDTSQFPVVYVGDLTILL